MAFTLSLFIQLDEIEFIESIAPIMFSFGYVQLIFYDLGSGHYTVRYFISFLNG